MTTIETPDACGELSPWPSQPVRCTRPAGHRFAHQAPGSTGPVSWAVMVTKRDGERRSDERREADRAVHYAEQNVLSVAVYIANASDLALLADGIDRMKEAVKLWEQATEAQAEAR